MKTFLAKKEDVSRKWLIIDAENKTLGRLATGVADILRGKNKPTYTPSVDTGDHVIVINASKIKLTGQKLKDKIYYRHSGFPGGLKAETAGHRLERMPELLIKDAVNGMLPKNKLRSQVIKKLKVYAGSEHPHSAQMPEMMN